MDLNDNILNSENVVDHDNELQQKLAYVYPGLNLLNTQYIEDCSENLEDATIHVCTYQINNTGDAPFLQFILRKYNKLHPEKADLLNFPSFKYRQCEFASDMCDLIENVICATYRINPDSYEYKGFLNNGSDFYVFYELSQNSISVHDLYRSNDLWLVLIDEIMNHRKCCNFVIENSVSEFFRNNKDFLYLMNLKGDYFESPTVAYTGCEYKKTNVVSCFGVTESLEDCFPDPHFYFTDFQNAVRMCSLVKDDHVRGGVVRFALFLGYTNFIINDENDSMNSIENYDSAYVGIHLNSPLLVLKKWERQTSLTCHYIDKTNLGETWDKNTTYYIV